ncbi:MAG: pyridoxal-phosphate dependent enzyme, partial [Candidatus Omnitrophica bacterium]|nr:pyridoxal-phosphate dependent enzyme [Candidatus Omnitrophota bacterium]
WKSFNEFKKLGLVGSVDSKVYAAQAEGCSPIVTAIREKSDIIKPVKPKTIAKSLAIGNPADGPYACDAVKESGGSGESVTDQEIVDAIKLLASTEGIFTETAGGVTMASAKKLIEKGVIPKNESCVICITGNGLKTQEAISEHIGKPYRIKPTLESFEKSLRSETKIKEEVWQSK